MSRYTMLLKSIPKLVKHSVRSEHAKLDREIFDLFSSMGGVYVKFLQIIIANTKMLQSLNEAERMSVFAESRPSRLQHRTVLRSQLAPAAFDQFIELDSEPFSTGSFANVYKARLRSGELVIVKIKRPGLERQLRVDLRVIRFVAWCVNLFDTSGRYDVRTIAREYSDGMRREVDYKAEASNAQIVYREYAQQVSDIVIPRTFSELSTKDIIVQEFLDGVLLSEVLKQPVEEIPGFVKARTGSDLKVLMHTLGVDTLMRCFAAQPVHGDPHPGNILLMNDNKVGLIDFGLIASPAEDALGYLDYMYEQTFINHGSIRPGKFGVTMLRTYSVRLYHSLSMIDSAMQHLNLLERMEKVMDSRFYQNVKDLPSVLHQMQGGHTTAIFDAVVNPGNQLALTADIDGMLMRRANHTIWTTFISLGIYRDIMPSVVDTAVKGAHSSATLSGSKYRGAPRDIEEAMEIIGQWLLSVRESDPIFFMAVKNLFPSRLWEA